MLISIAYKTVALLALTFSLSSLATGQQKRPVKKRTTSRAVQTIPPPKTIILDTTPTVTERKALKPLSNPGNVVSNQCASIFCPDIGEIFSTLLDNNDKFSKGKFEKTADWEKRMTHVLDDVKLSNGKLASETIVFLYEQGTGSLENHDATYDADREKWTFPLLFRTVNGKTCLPLASNKTGELYCLLVDTKIDRVESASVAMSPPVAQINDGKIQLAFVGKISSPYLWTDSSAIRDIMQGVYFDLHEIVCLNPKTGQKWKVDYTVAPPLEISVVPMVVPQKRNFELDFSTPKQTRSIDPTVTQPAAQKLVQDTFFLFSTSLDAKEPSIIYRQLAKKAQEETTPGKILEGFQTFFNQRKTYRNLFRSISQSNQLGFIEQQYQKLGDLPFVKLSGQQMINWLQSMRFEFIYQYEMNEWRVYAFYIKVV